MYDKIIVPMTLDHGIGPGAVKVARKLLKDGGEIIALHIHEEVQGSVSAYLARTWPKNLTTASRLNWTNALRPSRMFQLLLSLAILAVRSLILQLRTRPTAS